jgi:hypothetical protein
LVTAGYGDAGAPAFWVVFEYLHFSLGVLGVIALYFFRLCWGAGGVP